MANYTNTKVLFPVSQTISNLIMKEFAEDASLEDGYVFIRTRGYHINDFLATISREHYEVINVQQTDSGNLYADVYTGKFDNGQFIEGETVHCVEVQIDDLIILVAPDDPVLKLDVATRNAALKQNYEECMAEIKAAQLRNKQS